MGKPIDLILARAASSDASEDDHQTAFFACLVERARVDTRLLFIHAIPNGGRRDSLTAGILTATGVKSGVWDISMPFISHKFPFGYIELKRPGLERKKNGGLSDNQVNFGRHLKEQGAFYAVCYGYLQALAALDKFLAGHDYYG